MHLLPMLLFLRGHRAYKKTLLRVVEVGVAFDASPANEGGGVVDVGIGAVETTELD